jgi:hypothetical protein
MTPLTILAGLAGIVTIGLLVYIALQLGKRPAGAAEQDPALLKEIADLEKDVATIKKDLEAEKAEKNKLSGANKQMFAENTRLKAEMDAVAKERDGLQKTLTKLETTQEQREKEHHKLIEKQEAALVALQEERKRVLEDEAAARQEMEEERDRLWNDHENMVIAGLVELCKLPHLQFRAYTNNSLPDDFDGSLKPDFLIDFLGQYVLFDAKVSKAENLQIYIDDQVKKTTDKIKKNSKIYPHVFLVVPTEAIGKLKKLMYAKDQYYFYVVSREALAAILAMLKRISTYELAETLDPQKRENIINMLAELATHISYRNAHELILTKMGADTLDRVSRTDPELAAEVEQKRQEKKFSSLQLSEIKRIAGSLAEQNAEVEGLAAPKAAVGRKAIDAAKNSMLQNLL